MESQYSKIQLLQFVILVISIITLLFVIAIFNRTGESLGIVVQEETQDAVNSTKLVTARAKANAELIALRTQVAAGMAADEAAQEVAEIRDDLAAAYEHANDEARQELRELDNDFQRLEQGFRNGAANVLSLLEDLAGRLEEEVRTDE